jgi:hypothetical protein
MSRGSPVVLLRLPPALLVALDAEVERQNATRVDEPYDRSGWVRQAIRERLAKLGRGRRSRRARREEMAGAGIVAPDAGAQKGGQQ